MSNSKLSVAQKQTLKNLRALRTDIEIFHFPDTRACVGIRRTGETMGEFSVAICAETETKYRKKVGELLVRERMESPSSTAASRRWKRPATTRRYGQCLPVELGEIDTAEWEESDREYLEGIANNIAQAVTGY